MLVRRLLGVRSNSAERGGVVDCGAFAIRASKRGDLERFVVLVVFRGLNGVQHACDPMEPDS
jgi:hypothetical protein